MCTSRPKVPAPQPAPPMPVNTSQTVGEELSPTLVTADEQDMKKKKKKVKKSGTSSLQTNAGVNVATGSPLNIA